MNERAQGPLRLDPGSVAAATAIVLAMTAAAGLAYLLLDVLLLVFLGIIVAAALQPWHLALGRWGVPKSVAVLLIYLLLLLVLGLLVLIVGPVLVEQLGRFVADVPDAYARGRAYLAASPSLPLQFLGERMPPLASLAPALSGLWPQVYENTVGLTGIIVRIPVWFVTVLAIAFYWTLEVSQLERLLVSMIVVERRPRALHVWHEIETKLGGFLRGQGLAMLFIGTASAIGYARIGLPNVLALGVLAGVLEAVPWIGPMLAVGPAVLVALPLGLHAVLMVFALAALLQFLESNVLVPRIMSHTVGVSALVGLLSILAFGTLYGMLGVLLAIPLAAVIQVLLDTFVVNVEARAPASGTDESPLGDLQARAAAAGQQARARLRARPGRLVDPATDEGGMDAVDGRIEAAAGRVEELIATARATHEGLAPETRTDLVEKLEEVTSEIDQGLAAEDLTGASERFTQAVSEAEAGAATGPPAAVPVPR